MKTFTEHIEDKNEKKNDLTESFEILVSEELSEQDEALIEEAVDAFEQSQMTLEDLEHELTNEGILGSVLGGLTGLALGKAVGKMVAKALGVQKGILYDLLTSRLVGAALGASVGKKFL